MSRCQTFVLTSFLSVWAPPTQEDFNIWEMRGGAATEQPRCVCCSSTLQREELVWKLWGCHGNNVRGQTLHRFMSLLMTRWMFYGCPLAHTRGSCFVGLSKLADLFSLPPVVWCWVQEYREKVSEVLSELVLPDSRRIKASWEKRRLWDLS